MFVLNKTYNLNFNAYLSNTISILTTLFLYFTELYKLMDMYDITSGQKQSYICGIQNLEQSLDELRILLETEKETEQKKIDKTIWQTEADRAATEDA